MVNRGLKRLVLFDDEYRSAAGLSAQAQFGRESRINQPNHCCPVPSEVVLAQPIHGLLRKRAAILAAEN
jgi:hypothetical protein